MTRILLVRLSAIGDLVHGLPVLCALRDHLPRAHVTWLAEDPQATLLDGHPALDGVLRAPPGWLGWLRPRPALRLLRTGALIPALRQVPAMRRRLRALGAELTIDLQGLSRSAASAWLSAAGRRIGFAPPDGRERSPWFNTELVPGGGGHIIARNLELLRPLGIAAPAVAFRLPEPAAAAAWAERYRREAALTEGFVMLAPGAGWTPKQWLPDRLGAVARHLGERHRRSVVVIWHGPEELARARTIVAGAGALARLAPTLSLTALAALARRAALFVGADTGPLHIAAAVGTPCVALFGPTSPARTGPYGQQHVVVQGDAAPGDARPPDGGSDPAMARIGVEAVQAACATILARAEPGRALGAGAERP